MCVCVYELASKSVLAYIFSADPTSSQEGETPHGHVVRVRGNNNNRNETELRWGGRGRVVQLDIDCVFVNLCT